MFDIDEKLEMFFRKELWETAMQHCIDKGIRPAELGKYTTPEFRAYFLSVLLEGKYKVAPPHIALIPKEVKGEYRKVYVNTVFDRFVLTMINEVYCSLYDHLIHPKCVSYQKGLGVKKIIGNIVREIQNLNDVKGKVLGYKIDISKYFDNVNRETMNAVLKSVDTGSALDKVLYDYYNDDLIMDENKTLIVKYKSLCQGCAPSAFFANLTLREVDDAMDKLCSVYYRYSDDLLLIGRNPDKILEKLASILEKKGLKINPKKVEPIYADSWFSFLGCKVKGNMVSLGKKSLDNFIKEIGSRTKLPKTKEYKYGCSEKELARAIKSINRYLYTAYVKNSSQFGWGEYFFGIINCEKDIEIMDQWLKDKLRAYATGSARGWQVGGLGSTNTENTQTILRGRGTSVSRNLRKTDGLLEKCGYVSMHHLYKVFHIDHDAYLAEINRLMM